MDDEYCSSVPKVNESTARLQWQDFVVLGCCLLVSAGIGLFFGYQQRKTSLKEYMLGNGQVSWFPVAMSLGATYFSALTVLTTPVEFYSYGTMYVYIIIAYLICIILCAELFVPMYKRFGTASIFEYLEARFSKWVRWLASFEFTVHYIMYNGMIIYLPALALETVTGLNRWAAVWMISLICIFYTSLGGMKAVIWTDTFQLCVISSGFLAIILKGAVMYKGFDEIIDTYRKGGRNIWNEFSFDPRVRHSFWSVIIGSILGGTGTTFCSSQGQIQRIMACKDQKTVRIASYAGWLLITLITIFAVLVGMTLFKFNECCDPYEAGWLDSKDQMVPYMTAEIFQSTPGVAGIYVTATLCGTLSTVSSGINSMATSVVEDILRPNEFKIFKAKKSDAFYSNLMKVLTVIFGLFCVAFAYMADNLEGIFQSALSLSGLLAGPVFAIFLLGFFNPYTETIGVLIGYFCGTAMGIWCYLGSRSYPPLPEFTNKLPTSILACNQTFIDDESSLFQGNDPMDDSLERPPIAEFYSISYLYLGTVGVVTTILISSIISGILVCTGKYSPRNLPENVLFKPIDDLIPRTVQPKKDFEKSEDSTKSEETVSSEL